MLKNNIQNYSYFRMKNFSSPGALFANPVKLYSVPFHLQIRGTFHPVVQRVIHGQGKIRDGTAALAYEMVVWLDVRVIPIKGAAEIYFSNQPLLHEYVQVSVHGAHTQVGKLILQLVIDPAGSGMCTRTLEQFIYPLSLSTSLVFCSQ
jgi:hypothetical protein